MNVLIILLTLIILSILIGFLFVYLVHVFSSISGNYDWGSFYEMINKIEKLKKEYSRTRFIIKGYYCKNIYFQYNESQSLSSDYGWNDFFVCEKYEDFVNL